MKNITYYLEKEQVQTILEYAMTCNFRNYLIMRILWRIGIRVSELLNIRPQDLEPHNQIVNITKAKGGKQRRVILDQETLGMVSDYILLHKIRDKQPVFHLSSVQVWNIVKKYGKMAGHNGDIHPHTFRHSYAIHLVRSGVDVRRVQLLLGHANLNTCAGVSAIQRR
jgi:integrase/recombinase XerD